MSANDQGGSGEGTAAARERGAAEGCSVRSAVFQGNNAGRGAGPSAHSHIEAQRGAVG